MARSNTITLVKNEAIGCAIGVPGSSVIDLGLSIDEAARILYIQSTIELGVLAAGKNSVGVWLSFDPEDTVTSAGDDEQFWHIGLAGSQLGATGGAKITDSCDTDYTHLNLITTRNLALIMSAPVLTSAGCEVKIFYEKFRPSKDDLVGLIAHRR